MRGQLSQLGRCQFLTSTLSTNLLGISLFGWDFPNIRVVSCYGTAGDRVRGCELLLRFAVHLVLPFWMKSDSDCSSFEVEVIPGERVLF
jgi:hypothetical protein